MTANVKLLCVDVPRDKSRGEIELSSPYTVERALEAYHEMYRLDIPLSEFKKSLFLVGKESAALDSVINEGDTLTVMRTMAGG